MKWKKTIATLDMSTVNPLDQIYFTKDRSVRISIDRQSAGNIFLLRWTAIRGALLITCLVIIIKKIYFIALPLSCDSLFY